MALATSARDWSIFLASAMRASPVETIIRYSRVRKRLMCCWISWACWAEGIQFWDMSVDTSLTRPSWITAVTATISVKRRTELKAKASLAPTDRRENMRDS